MEEEIIGNIKGVVLPEFTDSVYNLIFTNERIIGDKVSGSDLALLVGGVGGMVWKTRRARKDALDMNIEGKPDEILSKNKRNFSIPYSDIKSISLKKKAIKMKLLKRTRIVGKSPMFTFKKDFHGEIESVLLKVLPEKTTVK